MQLSSTEQFGISQGSMVTYSWQRTNLSPNVKFPQDFQFIFNPFITGPPNGPVLFCSQVSVVCHLSGSVTLYGDDIMLPPV